MPLRGDLRSVPVPGAVDGGSRCMRATGDWLWSRCSTRRSPWPRRLRRLHHAGVASHLIADVPGRQGCAPTARSSPMPRCDCPGIARTLGAIVADGRDGFYRGEFGRGSDRIGAGLYAPADLEHNVADWCQPLRLRVWGHDLWTVPPPSQGYLTLASAWVAEQAGLGTDPSDPEWAHLIIEAARAAGHDRPDLRCSTAPTGRPSWPRNGCTPRRRSVGAAAAPDVVAANRNTDATLSPGLRRRRHHAPVRRRRRRTRDFADAVQRARLRGACGGRVHRHLPTQPWRRLLAAGRARGRTRTRAVVLPTPCPPCWSTTAAGSLSHLVGAMGGAMASRRSSCSCWPGCCAGARTRPPPSPPARLALDRAISRTLPAVVGPMISPCRWSRTRPRGGTTRSAARGHQVRRSAPIDPTAVGCAQIISVRRDAAGPARHFVGAADPRSPEGGTATR